MRRMRVLGIAVVLAAAAACSTTEFKSTWKDPTAQPGELQGKRVAAFVNTPNESVRRSAEDALAAELGRRGLQAIPGYLLVGNAPLPADQLQDQQKLRQLLAPQNIQAAVVMRIVGSRQEVNYSPGADAFYPGWGYGGWGHGGWGYGGWGYGWASAYDPGYLSTDTVVSVETLVYSIRDGKLIWAGMSESVDPDKVDKMFKDIVDKATDQMKKQGLIAN